MWHVSYRYYRALSTVTRQSTIQLRDYQKECLNASVEAFLSGVKRQLVVLPVGSGKTVIFSHLIERILPTITHAPRVLVLAHREELLKQSINQIARINPNLRISLDQGRFKADLESDIIVASVPTLGRLNNKRLPLYDPDKIGLVIVDEAHHAIADTYLRIFDYFNLRNSNSNTLLWGCTATPCRFDNFGLYPVFQQITYEKNMMKMMNDGWLSAIDAKGVSTHVSLAHVGLDKSGDYQPLKLALTVNTPKRNELISRIWYDEAREKSNRNCTLVFAVNIDHAQSLAEAFAEFCNVKAVSLTSKTDSATRAIILNQFRRGEIPVLVNCGILTEGTDIPNIDCIVMARPTRSQALYTQMVGRGVRLHNNKENCLLLDFIDDVSSDHARKLVSFVTLAGRDKEAEEKEKSINVQEEEAEEELMVVSPSDARKSGFDINLEKTNIIINELDLFHCQNSSNASSPFAWVSLGADVWALRATIGMDKYFLTLKVTASGSFKLQRWFILYRHKDEPKCQDMHESTIDMNQVTAMIYDLIRQKSDGKPPKIFRNDQTRSFESRQEIVYGALKRAGFRSLTYFLCGKVESGHIHDFETRFLFASRVLKEQPSWEWLTSGLQSFRHIRVEPLGRKHSGKLISR